MGHIDGPVSGLVAIAQATLVLGAIVGGVLYQAEIVRGLRRLVIKVSPPTPPPEGPAIERIGYGCASAPHSTAHIGPGHTDGAADRSATGV